MLLRRKLTLVLMAVVMVLMLSAAPALVHQDVALAKLGNSGNKGFDGADKNKGGGQEKPKNENYSGHGSNRVH